MKTIGLSPKLYPALVAIVVGLVLVVLGEKDTGLAVLLTGTGALGLGAAAPAAPVAYEVGQPSDELLDRELDDRPPAA